MLCGFNIKKKKRISLFECFLLFKSFSSTQWIWIRSLVDSSKLTYYVQAFHKILSNIFQILFRKSHVTCLFLRLLFIIDWSETIALVQKVRSETRLKFPKDAVWRGKFKIVQNGYMTDLDSVRRASKTFSRFLSNIQQLHSWITIV